MKRGIRIYGVLGLESAEAEAVGLRAAEYDRISKLLKADNTKLT